MVFYIKNLAFNTNDGEQNTFASSRSGNASLNWSVTEGSSCDTMSIALSEMTDVSCLPSNPLACFQNQVRETRTMNCQLVSLAGWPLSQGFSN